MGGLPQRSDSRSSPEVWIQPTRPHNNDFYGGVDSSGSLLVIFNHTSDEYAVTIDGSSAGTIIGKSQKSFGLIAKGSHSICFIQTGTSNPRTYNKKAEAIGNCETIGIDIP